MENEMIHDRQTARSFKLHLRCTNCLKPAVRSLDVPDAHDAPRDVDELMESALLGRLSFACQCGSVIGQVVSVKGPTAS
jgi:hypothetical protein